MEVIRLTLEDCRLLATRFDDYENSHLRLEEALTAGEDPEGDGSALSRLRALRRLECHFSIDLGSLYHRFRHRTEPGIHPLERGILDSIARWHHGPDGERELWILVDNIRQVRELIDEDRAEWLEPVQK